MGQYTDKPIVNIPFPVLTPIFKPFMTEKVFRDFNFQDKLLFTFVGALEFRKGVHLIIEALSGFKTVPNAHLIIAARVILNTKKLANLIKNTILRLRLLKFLG